MWSSQYRMPDLLAAAGLCFPVVQGITSHFLANGEVLNGCMMGSVTRIDLPAAQLFALWTKGMFNFAVGPSGCAAALWVAPPPHLQNRVKWAGLLKCAGGLDALECGPCGGRTATAVVEDPESAARSLAHSGVRGGQGPGRWP